MDSLYDIPNGARGLLGLVRDTGRKLEDRLKKGPKDDDSHNTGVTYYYDERGKTAGLEWVYSASEYDFSSSLWFEEGDEDGEITIDEFPNVTVKNNSLGTRPTTSPQEMRRAADISEDVTRFLKEEFGESKSQRGNDCPIYRTKLSDKYREAASVK